MFLYNISIKIYGLFLFIVAIFNSRAKQLIQGRNRQIDSLEGIKEWLTSLIPAVAKNVYSNFLIEWEKTPWKMDGKGPDDIQISTI